jgi:hypothetical protein
MMNRPASCRISVRQSLRCVLSVCLALSALQFSEQLAAETAGNAAKRPFTVRDSIGWTHVVPFAAQRASHARRVALFSPDGSRFVVQTRRGDLGRNLNVDALLLFDAREVRNYAGSARRAAPKPVVLASIDALKDEDSLTATQWLSESRVGFIARATDGFKQAFTVDAATGLLRQLTASTADVMAFSQVGDSVAYYACARGAEEKASAVVVSSFDDALQLPQTNGPACYITSTVELFAGVTDGTVRRLPLPAMQLLPQFRRIWISPDGAHAVILAPAVNAPAGWSEYDGPGHEWLAFTAAAVRSDPKSMDLLGRTRYLLVDLRDGSIRPLLDAPTGQMSMNNTPLDVFWRKDGRSVIVSNTYLPLDGVDSAVRLRRAHHPFIAEVDITSKEVIPVAGEETRPDARTRMPNPIVDFEWDAAADCLTVIRERAADGVNSRETHCRAGNHWQRGRAPKASVRDAVQVDEHQTLNERPMVRVRHGNSGRRKLLFDPNPQADQLNFGVARAIQWQDENGTKWTGGLLLPPAYVAGRKYPLVVQTHGFSAAKFLLDGPNDEQGGGTAFAAQALANAGFVVLQIEDNPQAITRDEHEGPATAAGFRAGIAQLIADGLVDALNIGLIAFSRTGWPALHLMARDPDMFAAVTMADTLSIGYSSFSYYSADSSATAQLAKLVGSKPAAASIGEWFSNNPLYASSRSKAAIRLEAMVTGLGMWELYGLLRQANRPVDFILYPDGSHVLQKPEERLASQGGSVDWFRFWLQRYEDPDPSKQEQYGRWRKLRALDEH